MSGDEKKREQVMVGLPRVGLPWVERYRPLDLAQVAGNSEVVNRLKLISRAGNVPNMILAGLPGTGKTTSVWCLARALLKEQMSEGFLELNASDSRGLEVIRSTVKIFAQKKVSFSNPTVKKMVLLDEADALTTTAQKGLRRLMDNFAETTRFALACNSVSNIIDSIQSRCVVLRFNRISDDEVKTRILSIVEEEKVEMPSADGIKALLFLAQGDLRQAINLLQAAKSTGKKITAQSIYKIADQPQPNAILQMIRSCLKGNAIEASLEMQALFRLGYAPIDIVTTLLRVAKTTVEITDEHKRCEMLEQIAIAHSQVADGLHSLLQLNALLCRLAKQNHFK